jgi:hypothetical protein
MLLCLLFIVICVLQRKPVTELKGTTVITHHFEGTALVSTLPGSACHAWPLFCLPACLRACSLVCLLAWSLSYLGAACLLACASLRAPHW